MAMTWFITGASRGIGKELVYAALEVGDNVVAGVRDPKNVEDWSKSSNRLFITRLDVTKEKQINSAVEVALEKFSRIDVLVNNAGYGYLGAFEESTSEDIRAEFDTNVFGLMNVTKAIIPLMRKPGKGRIFNISSIAGLKGSLGNSIYSASKFAVEGFSQAIAEELAPLGIQVTCISPGFFRTDFLDKHSVKYAKRTISDYDGIMNDYLNFLANRNHNQLGDPKALAKVVVQLARTDNLPVSFIAGSDAVEWVTTAMFEKKLEFDKWKELSLCTDRRDC